MFALTYEVAIKNQVLGRVKKHYIVFFVFFFYFIFLRRIPTTLGLFFLAGWPDVDLSPRSIHFNHNGQRGGGLGGVEVVAVVRRGCAN